MGEVTARCICPFMSLKYGSTVGVLLLDALDSGAC